MPGTHIVLRISPIPGKFNILADCLEVGQTFEYRMVVGSIGVEDIVIHLSKTQFPNVDLFTTRFSHKLPLFVHVLPVPDNQALVIEALSMNWNYLHAYAFSTNNSDTF